MENYSGPEKRHYPRAPVRVEVFCEDLPADQRRGSAVLCFYSVNVSVGGIFLESEVPFRSGSRIFLRFTLPDSAQPLRLVGRVVRISGRHPETVPGMGVEFEHLGYTEERVIREFVIGSEA